MKIHHVQKWNRLRFTNAEIYIPQDSTSRRRRIFDDPWGGGVQGAHWRLHKNNKQTNKQPNKQTEKNCIYKYMFAFLIVLSILLSEINEWLIQGKCILRYEMCNWRGNDMVTLCKTTSSGWFYNCTDIHFKQHNITSAWPLLSNSPGLTAQNWQKWKSTFLTCTKFTKFIGKKQLV